MATADVATARPLLLVPSTRSEEKVNSGERTCRALLWLAISFYTFFVLRLAFYFQDRAFDHSVMGFDLAIFDQAAWLISRGQTPFVTVRGVHLLGDHFSVVLYALAPLYWLWDNAKALLAAQTIALALGALPVYALARDKTASPAVGLLFAAAYLLFPAVQWSNTFEFHPDTFATPLLLAAFLFLSRRQWRCYFAALGVALLTKETVGLTVMALGVYVLLQAKLLQANQLKIERRIGWLTVGLGALGLLTALATVRHFNGGAPSGHYWLYAKYGDNLPAIASHLLSHPLQVASDLGAGAKREYLLGLFQPLMFLPLLAPELLLVAAPALLTCLLSARAEMHSPQSGYYAAAITPFLFVAAINGYNRLGRRLGPWGMAALGANLLLWSLAGAMQGPLWRHRSLLFPSAVTAAQSQEKRRIAEARNFLAAIPAQASVSAQVGLLRHLSHRRSIYTFPNPFFEKVWGGGGAVRRDLETDAGLSIRPPRLKLHEAIARAPVEYVALCPYTRRFPLANETFAECVTILLQNPAYGIVAIGESAILLRRGADYERGLRLLQRRARVHIAGAGAARARDIEKAFYTWTAGQPAPG